MRRNVAKMIREISEAQGISKKFLKKKYYSLSDKERHLMKREMRFALDNPDYLSDLNEENEDKV